MRSGTIEGEMMRRQKISNRRKLTGLGYPTNLTVKCVAPG
jgi:hypothetical protein